MNESKSTWAEALRDGVEMVRKAKRAQTRVDEWFFVQEIKMREREAMLAEGKPPDTAAGQAELLCRIARQAPLSILAGSAIAGTQDGAFSPSYALINPSFKVEEFAGYCDPTAIYNDIVPDGENGLTAERIHTVRQYWEQTPYVGKLQAIYEATGDEAKEVVFFMEPVTGHTIPDMRPFLKNGVADMQKRARKSGTAYGAAMAEALEAPLILARRYRELAERLARETGDEAEKARLSAIVKNLERVPARGARNLHEAVQSFVLLWQAMVLEQAPNPYAFSAGNIDRVFAPYYDKGGVSRDEAVELIRNLLCFYQVGARCWAISQNVIVGGKDKTGADLTSEMTNIVLDAFFATNDPQPALSVKVHSDAPDALYRSLGRFFFTPGHSTPSLFNDDTMFEVLGGQGIAAGDLPDYSIAGCQEPLIMGKASLNTTNTWLNLGKVLELAGNDGVSLITGKKIGPSWKELGYTGGSDQVYANLEDAFFKTLDAVLPDMEKAGNACTTLLGEYKPVPFTSAVMDSFHTWRDMRDPRNPGTRYNASGCLIHGLSVVADSLHAAGRALVSGQWAASDIRAALQSNFKGHDDLRHFLLNQEKFGGDHAQVDEIAARVADGVSDRVRALKNPAGKPYLADWSTPSTHLLYGYWVGATPDGREARTMLGYGLDPRAGASRPALPERMLSAWKLPYLKMTGGYGSHIGLQPSAAEKAASLDDKGLWMRDRVVKPLFRLGEGIAETPYYVYMNVDSASHLREVLKNPAKHAPTGIYIMRIHGTFVNFLDLSPAIQEDIITRLEAGGQAM